MNLNVNPESQSEQNKMGRPRKVSEEFCAQALERMKSCDNVTSLVWELGFGRKFLYRWREQALGRVPEPRFSPKPKQTSEERERKRIGELERLVAQQALEIEGLRRKLLH